MLRFLLLSIIVFVDGSLGFEKNDYGSFSYPYGCSGKYCKYTAKWRYLRASDSVEFTVSGKVSEGYWVGIGFSFDRNMINSDCYTAYATGYGKRLAFFDRYLFGRRPDLVPADSKQNGYVKHHSYENGRLTYTFVRERFTRDPRDVSLTKCVYFLHAWGGKGMGEKISKHTDAIVSKRKICIGPREVSGPGNYKPSYGPGKMWNENSFRFPAGCKPGYCEYEAEWKDDDYNVYFTMNAKVKTGQWVGIGFSDDQMMIDSDCITGYVPWSGPPFVLQDRFLLGRRSDSVPPDRQQDAYLTYHSYNEGGLKFKFKRRKNTGDKWDLSLDMCRYLLFAWGGKAEDGGIITAHTKKMVSRNEVCFGRRTRAGYGSNYESGSEGGYGDRSTSHGHGSDGGPGYDSKPWSYESADRPGYGQEHGGRSTGYGSNTKPDDYAGGDYGGGGDYRRDPCDGYDCGGHGKCKYADGKHSCDCDNGYNYSDGRCQ